MTRRISIISLVILAVIQTAMADIPNPKEFFKSINGNLTKITWKHAVNSKKELTEAIAAADVMMVEADVVLGNLTGNSGATKIPIMAHPPNVTSDLSLDEFLTVVLKNRTKGLKLDFKSIEAFKEGLEVLEKHKLNLTVPLWLNADILFGPVNATIGTITPVSAKDFLEGTKRTVPQSTLSIGWVTRYDAKNNITGNYTNAHIQEMIKTLKDNNVNQTVTYPVRAALALTDIGVLKALLKDSPKNATLTIWSSKDDVVDGKKLSKLITEVGVDKVYVDVPTAVWKTLNLSKGGASYIGSSIVLTIVTVLATTFTTGML